MKVLPSPCTKARPSRGSDDHVKWRSPISTFVLYTLTLKYSDFFGYRPDWSFKSRCNIVCQLSRDVIGYSLPRSPERSSSTYLLSYTVITFVIVTMYLFLGTDH